jgi:hypothetical protein
MQDLKRALADIGDIRQQMASGMLFRGFGPAVMACSGLLALATAAAQTAWFAEVSRDPAVFFGAWIATALLSCGLIGFEMVARTRRHHGGLADEMIINAVEHFLPAGAAGVVIGVVLMRFAPQTVWMLPGLWAILVGVGLFASVRFLPRMVGLAGAWYFLAGMTVLIVAARTESLIPWAMGVPFGLGQLVLAGILHMAFGGENDRRS